MSDLPFDPMGSDILEVPFLWVPEGAPRPGHPWFEAGRMTVSAERLAAWSAANASQRSGQARSGDQAVPGPWSVDVWNETIPAAEAPVARDGPSEIGAAIKAWNALSDPRTTL